MRHGRSSLLKYVAWHLGPILTDAIAIYYRSLVVNVRQRRTECSHYLMAPSIFSVTDW
jgi:hypothetical protein